LKRGENASAAGTELVRQRGTEYMREIGSRGGKVGGAAIAKRGRRYMRHLAKLAVAAVTPEQRRENGRKGGLAARGRSGRPKR
jgi:hypothetical protein